MHKGVDIRALYMRALSYKGVYMRALYQGDYIRALYDRICIISPAGDMFSPTLKVPAGAQRSLSSLTRRATGSGPSAGPRMCSAVTWAGPLRHSSSLAFESVGKLL